VKGKIAAAAAFGLITAAALYAHTSAVRREAAGGDRAAVLIALQDLEAGAKLAKADVGVKSIPAAYVHPDTLTEADADRALGQSTRRALRAGQVLLWSDLQTRSEPKPLARQIPPGQRALTLPVDVSSSLGGALRPGDRVDLLGTFARTSDADRATVTLLQNVPVLAAGAGSTEGAAAEHITVAVDLEEAELLTFALSRGQVQVVLRHERDRAVLERVPDKTFADIFEVERRAAMSRRRTIEQIRGAEP